MNNSTNALAAPQQAFIEKYAPTSVNELVYPSQRVENIIKAIANGTKPAHLILYGGTGTGKTSACRLIATSLVGGPEFYSDVLEIHASVDGKKNDVASSVKNFAPTLSLNPTGKRVVIIDECDCLADGAKEALKGLITQWGQYVTFLFTTNKINDVDAATKSRCTVLQYDGFTETHWLSRAQRILAKEGKGVSVPKLRKMLAPVAADGRKVLEELENYVLFG